MDIVTLAAARKYADTKFLGFVPKGAYNPANENKYGEWYTHEGGSYGYIYPTPSTGVPVTDTTHWQQIASVGGQDLVDAAVAARDAAQGYKDAAEGYAAQLAAGLLRPKGVYADLAALNSGTPTVADTDEIYITLDDGKWCYYNGTAWVAGGQFQAFADQSIDIGKLSFTIPGKNIFNNAKATVGYYVNAATGALVSGAGYFATDYIPALPLTDYVQSHSTENNTIAAAFYDSNKNYLSGFGMGAVKTWKTPANTAYIRTTGRASTGATLGNFQVELGTESTTYEAFYQIISADSVEKHGILLADVPQLPITKLDFAVTSSNLFDKTAFSGGYINSSTGALVVNAQYAASEYIPVSAETVYTIGCYRHIAYYTSAKVFISGVAGAPQYNGQITTPASTAFVRFSWYLADDMMTVAAQQMNLGAALLPYEEYTHYIPSECVEPNPDEFLLFLPDEICVAVGRTIELYNRQVCWCGNIDNYHFKWDCEVGMPLKRKFSVTGTVPLIGEYLLVLSVYDNNMSRVAYATTTLKIVSATIAAPKTLLNLGDSLTNGKAWLEELRTLSANQYTMVGTRGTAPLQHEGRSGFSAASYLAATAYTYESEGVHPFWNAGESRFDWDYYKAETSINPDAVQIFLGTNGIAIDPTANAAAIQDIVDYIRADDATIPIFLVFTLYRGNQDGIGVQTDVDGYTVNQGVWKTQEDRKVFNLMVKLYDLLSDYTDLHFVPISLAHDSEYNFGAVETPVNPRAAQVEYLPTEATHPQTQGYYQMADIMFSVMAKYL